MSRSRRLQRLSSTSNSSSSSTSPERGEDDDNDSFMLQANDSQSSLGMEMSPENSQDDSARQEYEERCRVSPVHRLPAELLISIFSRLTANSDLQSCMLVSKEWARNSVGLLWHRPAMNKWDCIHNVVQSIRKSNKFFAYQDLVKRLNMSTLANQVSDGTITGMTDCNRIERLTLTNCTKLTDLSLQPLVDGSRSLLALDVTGLDQVTDKTMMTVADNCLRLQGLNVTGCKKLTDASIAAVAKNCRHLKRLKFNNCVQLTDASILTVADYSTHLLEIDLYGLQNLESPSVTALLTSCTHLREMRLAHCSRINDVAFLDIPHNPDHPRTFDSLRILDLTDCNELGDKGVEKIIQACPRLRNLILAKCRAITDRAVFAITKLGKNLHYIHLGHCARITDLSVEALAKACNRIRYIDLACCINLTDNSVTRLAGLPKLKRIGLVKCSGITDRSIYALAMGEIKNGRRINGISVLERVHLSYCTLLTLDGIHVLLNNCPKLTHLSLTGVQAFLRDELLAYCREAPPEFNDHQRDVFCVFSGGGVGRLREFLNTQKANAASDAAGSNGVGDNVSEMGDAEDSVTDTNGTNTPVMLVNVQGNHAPGATPVVPTPTSGSSNTPPVLLTHALSNHTWQQQYPLSAGGSSNLSQSAPASTGGPLWGGPPAGLGLGNQGGAQHVTGMMGAAILDEVDEGDEAFGEGSEIMGD
ncbi:SCF ubiquitin ligase complex subunit [Vermiconidia calcicola]|uniref:SCF ubiquitin ligase complex subunit n=1 Tax=Vermiconidia calcicola TaxID=1690605 RepID=A0ACC3MXU7_9PEZI|nr:SCF ubiquitin ligase complex subunit [Vermiconidia calcicola]